MYYIYVIINKINNKLYVGKTNNTKRRWQEHRKVAKGGKCIFGRNFRAIHSAMAKYGVANFSIAEIEKWDDEQDVFDAEEFWIEFFNSDIKSNGYNETSGGDGFKSGKNNPMFGKSPSPETRAKLRKKRAGRKPALGMRHSEETKISMSENRKGDKNPMFGKSHSENTKMLISAAKKDSDKNRGSLHYLAVLTSEQASEIRRQFQNGNKKSDIAKKFGVRWLTVHRIVIGETYKN